jgi:RNA polymerase sigma factor (sigma-70 family)
MDDRHLVEQLVSGSESAAEEFFCRYRPRIIHALGAMGVATADCDDVAQDVLLDAWRQLTGGKFQHRSELFTWIRTLVKGKAIDHFRWPENLNASRRDSLEDPRTAISVPEQHGKPTPDELLMIEQALAELPIRLRLIFEMRYRDGCDRKEIARRFRIAEHTVSNLLTDARQRFLAQNSASGKNSGIYRLRKGKNAWRGCAPRLRWDRVYVGLTLLLLRRIDAQGARTHGSAFDWMRRVLAW